MKTNKKNVRFALITAVVALANLHGIARADAPTLPIKTEWSTAEVREMTDTYAEIYGVSKKTLHTVISGESGYRWDDRGDMEKGVYTSFGAAQIHLPDHPEISKEQALNPEFAVEWAARNISQGKGRMWTVYRACIKGEKIFYKGKPFRVACS